MNNELKSKFIVIEQENSNERYIYIGRCIFHKELLQRVNDRNNNGFKYKCLGGGEFKIDLYNTEHKILTLFGESHDFGKYPIDITLDIIKNKKIFDNPFLYPRDISSRNVLTIDIEDYISYPKKIITTFY